MGFSSWGLREVVEFFHLIFTFRNFIHSHLSTVLVSVPEATACPGREIHSLLAGMSPPIRLLNVSNLSHGGSTHILPTYPAPFQEPSGVKRKAQGVQNPAWRLPTGRH
jgi:hypothetical protein